MEKQRVFTRKAIGIATYFGGPIVAGYLVSKNYKLFGDEEKARNAILLSILFFVIFIELFFLIPDPISDKIPNFLFPLIYTWIVYRIVEVTQEEKIDKFLEDGGKKESGWKIAGISALGLIISISYILFRVSFIAPFEGDVKNFGKLEHAIYYDHEIAVSEIDKLALALTDFGYFGADFQQDVLIKRSEETYTLYIYVLKDWWENRDIIESLNFLQNYLSSEIMSLPVEIIMIDETFKGRVEKKLPDLEIQN